MWIQENIYSCLTENGEGEEVEAGEGDDQASKLLEQEHKYMFYAQMNNHNKKQKKHESLHLVTFTFFTVELSVCQALTESLNDI